MPTDADTARIAFLPLDDVTKATGLVQAFHNAWWSVCPERGLIFYQDNPRRKGSLVGASAQCNQSEGTSRTLSHRLYPWAEVRQIPLVLQPVKIKDYYP